MLALSIKQPWAELIARGEKTEEYRSRAIRYRGPLLVVSSRSYDPSAPTKGTAVDWPRGVAVCVVDVVGCRECDDDGYGGFAWQLANPRRVENVAVRGSQGFFHAVDSMIRFVEGAPILKAPTPPRSNVRTNRVPGQKRGPYTFQQDDRKIRGKSAATMGEARKLAREIANELGDYVYIMRDGLNVAGEWHSAARVDE